MLLNNLFTSQETSLLLYHDTLAELVKGLKWGPYVSKIEMIFHYTIVDQLHQSTPSE